MNLLSKLARHKHEHPLAYRLLFYILLCSSVITLLATALQLYLDYRRDVSLIEERMVQIETSYLANVANGVWMIDPDVVNLQLQGILKLPDVEYLEVKTSTGEIYTVGQQPEYAATITRFFPMHYTSEEDKHDLGTLEVIASLEEVYQRLIDKTLVILTTQAIKTFLVSLFILFMVQYLVTRHLGNMASYARQLDIDHLQVPLILKRKSSNVNDELEQVVNAINDMSATLHESYDELDARVIERTTQLNAKVEELTQTRNKLVQSEKMASLGRLVAGVAHEINTPIGIGLMSASTLTKKTEVAINAFKSNQLKKSTMAAYFDQVTHGSQLILRNLERASELVKSFKQVAVDQSNLEKRSFVVKKYLEEMLVTLKPKLKKTPHQITLNGDEQIKINSYPGAFSQVVTNLLMNSITHAYQEGEVGQLCFDIRGESEQVIIEYSDDGCGIPTEHLPKIFDPFFTTGRIKGGTGLGLHITYNLVTQKLKGTIQVESVVGVGTTFIINLPLTQ